MTAPTNLAEALDVLQAFLPTDRRLFIMQHSSGSISINVATGGWPGKMKEIEGRAVYTPNGGKLSDALFEAERAHADAWNAKHGPLAAAEAEFGAYCPRLAA